MKKFQKARENISMANFYSSKMKKNSKKWRMRLDFIDDYINYMKDFEN